MRKSASHLPKNFLKARAIQNIREIYAWVLELNYAQNPFDCISCKEESRTSTFISLLCKEAQSIAHLFHSLSKREKWRPGWLKNE